MVVSVGGGGGGAPQNAHQKESESATHKRQMQHAQPRAAAAAAHAGTRAGTHTHTHTHPQHTTQHTPQRTTHNTAHTTTRAHLVVEQPAHVRPPKALVRRVRVERRVGVQVVVAVRAHPLDRLALPALRAHPREKVLKRLGRLERAVREQAVVAVVCVCVCGVLCGGVFRARACVCVRGLGLSLGNATRPLLRPPKHSRS